MWSANLTKLRSAYSIVFELTQSLGLVLEHDKSEVFHFFRVNGDTNPLVDLSYAVSLASQTYNIMTRHSLHMLHTPSAALCTCSTTSSDTCSTHPLTQPLHIL